VLVSADGDRLVYGETAGTYVCFPLACTVRRRSRPTRAFRRTWAGQESTRSCRHRARVGQPLSRDARAWLPARTGPAGQVPA
jgi:hypothetical protein